MRKLMGSKAPERKDPLMQEDFHYYATYCAAWLAGYTHQESLTIAYSAQFTDCCCRTFLQKINGPVMAATTQTQIELADCRTDILGLQDITRIWASFHFLPKDLYAPLRHRGRHYSSKYRLICGPDGELVSRTVELARGKSLQAVGIAMHVLADTWAHSNFAGTPSLVINNTDSCFYELIPDKDTWREEPVVFRHNPAAPEDVIKRHYTGSVYVGDENSIMNLGHGRAGHLPDYSFIRYKYMPAWGHYRILYKDNPSDYEKAFGQMVYALRYLKQVHTGKKAEENIKEEDKGKKEGNIEACTEHFMTGIYGEELIAPYRSRIRGILEKRQVNACADWKAFGEELSGMPIEDFDLHKYQQEYLLADTDPDKIEAEGKEETFLGKFFEAAIRQKSMVTTEIFKSGNLLAGIPSGKRRELLQLRRLGKTIMKKGKTE